MGPVAPQPLPGDYLARSRSPPTGPDVDHAFLAREADRGDRKMAEPVGDGANRLGATLHQRTTTVETSASCPSCCGALGDEAGREHQGTIVCIVTIARRSWLEEFESLAVMEADPGTPRCEEVWRPVHALAEPGTFRASIWTDPQRGVWFEQ